MEKADELLQKQNESYKHFKEILISYIELEISLKAFAEKFTVNDSENFIYKIKFLKMKLIRNRPKRNMSKIKLMFIKLMLVGG